MKNVTLFLIFLTVQSVAQNNLNIEFVSNLDYTSQCNDIWGYTDNNGIEYAIVGTRAATSIVSLKDPSNPVEVVSIDGVSSIWRDIKTHGDFAYIVADQGADGLLIIDMSNLPDSVSHTFWKPNIDINGFPTLLRTCHNLYIDNGYIYLSGCNISNQGIIILDINEDPLHPIVLGAADLNYSHDAFVRDNILFTSEINRGQLGIYDVSDKTNPQLLATQRTSSAFTHNAWSSDDNKTVFTTDERGNGFLDAYDISNIDEIQKLDSYAVLATKDRGVIPHNTHYHNGFLITSWYTEGIIVIDAHNPNNLIRVAQYDTWPGRDGGFDGVWGAFPFLPSGLILASDISTGLYVLEPDYQRAAYLEGTVTDEDSGFSVNGASIKILSDDPNEGISGVMGLYKTGQATSGTFLAVASQSQYISDTIQIELNNGEITIADFALKPLSKNVLSTIITDIITGEPITDAQILLITSNGDIRGNSNEFGQFQTEIFIGKTKILVGKLGYKTVSQDFVSNETGAVEINMEKGIMDDFNFDFGWSVQSTSASGQWIRAIPEGTFLENAVSNPDGDLINDIGDYAFVTGNNALNVGFDDVDGGNTVLMSPIFDLTEMQNPQIEYSLWFYNGGGDGTTPNDFLEVTLSDGTNTVVVEEVRDLTSNSGRWREKSSIPIKDFFDNLETIQLSISVSDDDPGHLVEGGFDGFSISEGSTTPTVEEIIGSQISVSPNPFDNHINIISDLNIETYSIIDIKGRVIGNYINNSNHSIQIETSNLLPSIYLIDMVLDNGQRVTKKIIKNAK